MFKKSLLIGIISISLTCFWGIEAMGAIRIGGAAFNPGSIIVNSWGTGGGNLDTSPALISATMILEAATVHCMNGGGQDGGEGQPFTFATTIEDADILDANNLDGRGLWSSEITFEQSMIEDAVFSSTTVTQMCINPNWEPIPGTLVIVEFTSTLKVWRCIDYDPDYPEVCNYDPSSPDDWATYACTLNFDENSYECNLVDEK